MGSLFYGSSPTPIRVPDRVLAHVKVVIATKLRRGESFTLSWRHPSGEPTGRSTLWIQPSIPLRFVFGSAEPEALDPALLHSLATSANSSGGLTIDLDDHAVPSVSEAH
ncbi:MULTISPECIES: DUF7882 family protein [Microbacterium]|uniref:DUF7882 family protein n=1 Tax=Microbacterium TaxID=33882 RepID=UPI000CCF9F01|nr:MULTISPECIES: hypothetical protein [Microbacterium]MDZ5145796.1 hypothetical protein [Microbacterium testaceum]PNW09817.1 hypothetical protein C1632_05305 [Microbacterium testaceum]REC99826.1 hypothetical protein DEU35_0802 [Microbacterium sp. AG157]WJS91461.1 hypothetical protein NYQ11_02600 [Microbacterium testaceum]